MKKLPFALCAVLALFVCAPAFGQSTATLAAKTCQLTMSAAAGPDGTTGWTVQFQRNGQNHGTKDSAAPYGPRSAAVDAGVYTLTALWTKGTQTTTEVIGAATCQDSTISVTPAVVIPSPPLEVCGDNIDNDGDGQIDEGCPPPPLEVCGDGIDNDQDGQVDEGCPPPPSGASPDGTAVPPAASITDSTGAVWTFGAQAPGGDPTLRYVLRNGQIASGGFGYSMVYVGGKVYVWGSDRNWYRWDGAWVNTGATPPSGSSVPPAQSSVTKPMTLSFTTDPAEYSELVTRFVLRVADAAGATVQTIDIAKPPLSVDGNVVTPVTVTLVEGKAYQAAVMACGMLCSAYSEAFGFVF